MEIEEKPRRRGRPPGAKNRKPRTAKPREELAQVFDKDAADLAGNGRDEASYEPEQPEAAPVSPKLVKLFITAVENGYLIRPAYSQGERGAAEDVRSWVAPSREELARMVTWLLAERGASASRDMLGGARLMPQPGSHYVPPRAFEEAGG